MSKLQGFFLSQPVAHKVTTAIKTGMLSLKQPKLNICTKTEKHVT